MTPHYVLIVKKDIVAFEEEVNNFLNRGYRLYGSPVVVNGAMAQAMVYWG